MATGRRHLDNPPGWISPAGRSYRAEYQDWEPPTWPENFDMGNFGPGNSDPDNFEPENFDMGNSAPDSFEPDMAEDLGTSLPLDPVREWPQWPPPAAA